MSEPTHRGPPDSEAQKGDLATADWRQIFERDFRPLDPDARYERAREAGGSALRALCFDPVSKVVRAVLENMQSGLEHARLIARHHRSSLGLDALGQRGEFLRDRQVQRHLFRNSQTSVRLLRRIFGMLHLTEVYRVAMSHDVATRVRSTAKTEFRQKFTAGSPDERVSLIHNTQGRCLGLLVGIGLDGRTASLLVQRPFQSTLLIRNLARWPATPPPVLIHMTRQAMVRRNPTLRNLILSHPNAPSRLKRDLGP